MSEYRTAVVARWPRTPLGTRVEVEFPFSYDPEDVGRELTVFTDQLWKGTAIFRVAIALKRALKALFRK